MKERKKERKKDRNKKIKKERKKERKRERKKERKNQVSKETKVRMKVRIPETYVRGRNSCSNKALINSLQVELATYILAVSRKNRLFRQKSKHLNENATFFKDRNIRNFICASSLSGWTSFSTAEILSSIMPYSHETFWHTILQKKDIFESWISLTNQDELLTKHKVP